MEFFKKHKTEIIENAFSYIVVMAMVAYGLGKLVQFKHVNELDLRISQMTGMQLMWAFYGYSRPFVLTLGALEIVGGMLMLFKKTRLIGCLFVSTILVNIIIQDIFYDVNVGALRAAILYQTLIFIILYLNKNIIVKVYKTLTDTKNIKDSVKNNFYKILASITLFILLRIAEYYITIKM